jgi:hypothetical protein
MKLAFRRLGFAGAATVSLILALYGPAWSGGSSEEEPHDHDDGPRYFGFVKDASGKIVPDAKVTAEIKGRGSVITRSDKVGTYKLPGFGKDIDPKMLSSRAARMATSRSEPSDARRRARLRKLRSRPSARCSV